MSFAERRTVKMNKRKRKKKEKLITDRQKRFCDEYLTDCNGAGAARRSGYSPGSAKSLLKQPEVQEYLRTQMEEIHNEKIADVKEISEYLTSVMRGNCGEQTKTSISDDKETTTYITVSAKERLKAAELMGKRYGLFRERTEVTVKPSVIINGEEDLC